MDFALYSSSVEHDTVGAGLSPGEVRQSVLDRVRGAFNRGLQGSLALPEQVVGQKPLAVAEVEDALYSASDELLSATVWQFPSETVYVLGEE
jgi:protein involved in polysaccharide export with SLBB domain